MGPGVQAGSDSCGECAPSPTAPMPSSVGMPSAAVKLPSEAPPVAASSSAKPRSAGKRLRFAKELNGSTAALHGRPVNAAGDDEEHRGSADLRAVNFRVMRGPSTRRAIRTSTSAQASAGITLLLVPPPATPTLTVRPRFKSVNPLTRSTTRASSRMALAPFSKSTPACAAMPFTSIRQLPVPLRAVL